MKCTTEIFGKTKEGNTVTAYTIANGNGMYATFLDYGAVLLNLYVPDRDGKLEDIVSGYDNMEDYEVNGPNYGAFVGRYANRIGNAKFTLNGKEYRVDANEGTNCLHGGFVHYNYLMYHVKTEENEDSVSVTFYRTSPDGEQGFPGNLEVSVTYTVTEKNELMVSYDGVSDEDTIINLTNHSYFNIGVGGHKNKDVLGLQLQLFASEYTPADDILLPTGEIKAVKNTPYDFTSAKQIGRDVQLDESKPDYFEGYDINYVLDHKPGEFAEAAILYCQENGRKMTVSTDQLGMQVYSALQVKNEKGKDGTVYGPFSGICFESQNFPNAVNEESFPSAVLKKGEHYSTKTLFAFTCD